MTLYVTCPADTIGPGPEALHQLAHHALALGYDAQMYYYDGSATIPAAYRGYQVRVATTVLDKADTIVVVPEVEPELLRAVNRGRRLMWWLSVDRFMAAGRLAADRGLSAYGRGPLDFVYDPGFRTVHVAQSEYARLHLMMQGIEAPMLGGYVADLDRWKALKSKPKADRIVYTAPEESRFMPALIEATKDMFKWVSTAGLTESELAALLGSSKVYADFGRHIGLPTLPMCAAMAGCVVLTGSCGAAANEIDLPIRRKFVFNESSADTMARVVVSVYKAFADHRGTVAEFSSYHRWIERQEYVFSKQLSGLLSSLDAPRLSALAEPVSA
jgi:hypothetical protein